MKTAVYDQPRFLSRPIVPLPNAVTRRQFLHKVLDTALAVACGVGVSVTLLFLLFLA
jgi:hypothetical protein